MAYRGAHFSPEPQEDGAYECIRAPRSVDEKLRTVRGAAGWGRDSRRSRVKAGSAENGGGPRHPLSRHNVLVIALIITLCLCATGGAIAWLTKSDFLVNKFEVGEVEIVVNEDFDQQGTEKRNVNVTNKGEVDAFVRARVSIYWVDAEGNQMWDKPIEQVDYTATDFPPSDTNWAEGTDGLYYWKVPLSPLDTTGNLIGSIVQSADQLSKYTDGRKLVVDISVQSIQSEPNNALEEAWGVKADASQEGALTLEVDDDGKVVVSNGEGE